MKRLPLVVLIAFLVLFVTPVLTMAQEKTAPAAAETVGRVPELEKFHTVIYKLWHTAWPKKDIPMLVALAPEITAGRGTRTSPSCSSALSATRRRQPVGIP
jgi:hypothetical protein